jgi:hypothetical protein
VSSRLTNRCVLAVAISASATACSATAAVLPDYITFGPSVTFGNYVATVFKHPDKTTGLHTSVWFNLDRAARTLEVVQWNIDAESDWYLVEAGDVFSRTTIEEDRFPILFTTDNPRPPIDLPSRNFYLAAASGHVPYGERTIFGWLQLEITGTRPFLGLQFVSSAVAIDSKGIVVGTHTQIPEPATIASFLVMAGALLARRAFR